METSYEQKVMSKKAKERNPLTVTFERRKRGMQYSHLIVAFRGSHVVVPTRCKTRKDSLPEIKKRLHEWVEGL